MSLLFDPLYPTVVQYVVSESIWELYEIHFWQLLFGKWGKNKAFLSLQHRYEKKHYEGTAIAILVFVFAFSYLIQWLMHWRQHLYLQRQPNPTNAVPEEPRNNAVLDGNQAQPNETNGAPNERNISGGGNQELNPGNNG